MKKSLKAILIASYSFLYLPLIAVVVYSFNASKMANIWSGFSLVWYKELFNNTVILQATMMSLKIACISATVAVILGTIAAIVMVRFNKFKGKGLFNIMLAAPLVMPDIMTGLSLLLMFVAASQWLGWPKERGMITITLAHITLSMAYVAIIVRARLADIDYSLEEAALDLGARPFKVLLLVTIPLIAPSLAVGWLLAFALSLDDLMIASFLSGPQATTLPMVIFSSIRHGLSTQINALATVIILVLSIGVIISALVIHRNSKKSFED